MAAASSAILSASSAVSGFASSWADSQAMRAQGEYQKSMAGINAKFAQVKSKLATDRGNREAADVKRKTKSLIGSQRAALAAQGIDIQSGSALQVQEDTAMIGELEALEIKNNSWMEAFGYRQEAARATQRGEIANISAQNAAGATLLTGGVNALNKGMGAFYESNFYQNSLKKDNGK